MMNNDFYTFSSYLKNNKKIITPSMEDYIEMIFRLGLKNNHEGIRVNVLSNALNIKPPSVTKMIKKLAELDICEYRKSSTVKLTKNGINIGEELLERHNTIELFLKKLGVENTLLEQTEKIEHIVNLETLECIKRYINNDS